MVGRRGYAGAAATQPNYHAPSSASIPRKVSGRDGTPPSTFQQHNHHHHAHHTSKSLPSPPIINPTKTLEEQVETLIDSLEPCKRSEERRHAVYDFVCITLEERFPCVNCHLMGSFPLKAYLADSDVDITISTCTCRVSLSNILYLRWAHDCSRTLVGAQIV